MKYIHQLKKVCIIYFFLSVLISPNKLLSNDTIQYKYFVGTSEPDVQWKELDFNDSLWLPGRGSIGYGDNDDSILIEPTTSLYIRYYLDSISYFPDNLNRMIGMVLNIDYDDGFIAYLNGIEIIRINIEKGILNPGHDQLTNRSHEAENYRDIEYLRNFGFFIDSSAIHSCSMGKGSMLAFQVHNDSVDGSDLSFHVRPEFIFDTTNGNIEDEPAFGWYTYTAQIDIDSSELPIVIIETDEYGFGNPYLANDIYAFMGIVNNIGYYNKPGDPKNAYNGSIRSHIHGKTSKSPPKRSFTIETQDSLGNNNNIALLGMPKENDWVLYGPYRDKSLIRNELVFRLGRKLGYYEPRTRFCELILNGQNKGLYVMTEKIKKDKNRVDIATLKPDENDYPDISGGYLFKFDHSDEIELVYPDENNISASQVNYINEFYDSLITVLTDINFSDPVTGFRKYIDSKSLIDYILITELTYHFDSYDGSVYLYKDKDPKGGQLHFGPCWDYDLGFLEPLYGNRYDKWCFWDESYLKIRNYLDDQQFTDELIARWQELRQGPFHSDSIINLINEIIEPLQPYIDRNYKVWPAIKRPIIFFAKTGESYEEEISMIKSLIKLRTSWMDENITLLKNNVSINDKHRYFTGGENSLQCFPNPFIDRLKVNINVALSGNLKICLFDLSGRIVYSYNENQIQADKNSLELIPDDNLAPGFYILKAWIGKTKFWEQKLIKVNSGYLR